MLFGCIFAVLLDDISVTLVEIVVGDFTDMGAAVRIISTSAELFICWINAGVCVYVIGTMGAGECTSATADASAGAGDGDGACAGAGDGDGACAGAGDGAGDGDGACAGAGDGDGAGAGEGADASAGAGAGAGAVSNSGSGMLNTNSGISNTSFGISVTTILTSPVFVFKVTISALTVDICILLSFYLFYSSGCSPGIPATSSGLRITSVARPLVFTSPSLKSDMYCSRDFGSSNSRAIISRRPSVR